MKRSGERHLPIVALLAVLGIALMHGLGLLPSAGSHREAPVEMSMSTGGTATISMTATDNGASVLGGSMDIVTTAAGGIASKTGATPHQEPMSGHMVHLCLVVLGAVAAALLGAAATVRRRSGAGGGTRTVGVSRYSEAGARWRPPDLAWLCVSRT